MKNNGDYEVGDIVQRAGQAWKVTEVVRTAGGNISYGMVPQPEVAK